MADADDRLPELPDDLLRRILHFAPLKEAASTTALSRRWRDPLWLSSGAVNLKTGGEHYNSSRRHNDKARFFSRRDIFVSAAAAALNAAVVPITRLTLRLESSLHERGYCFPHYYQENMRHKLYTDLVHVVLSHTAARRVEELQLVAKDPTEHLYGNRAGYTVTLDSLSFETLRVLELTNCMGLIYQKEAAVPVFSWMSSLRMSHCALHLSSLQRLIDAAPLLASVRLETVLFDATAPSHLRCPAASMLVLDSCRWKGQNYPYIIEQIHAPRLGCFRYKGPLRSFSFSPQPDELEQVNLELSRHGNNGNIKDPHRDSEIYWRFIRNFSSTKEMRLRVNNLENIAVLGEEKRVELLPSFHRLERLEVQGVNSTEGKTPAVTIFNLLRCCPVLSALQINLTSNDKASNKKEVADARIPQKEIQIAASTLCHLSQCLQSSLRRVSVQFCPEKSNCLGVKLLRFFAENATVLEEMYIDGGEETFCEHMNSKIEEWNSKRRESEAKSFVVLPLKR